MWLTKKIPTTMYLRGKKRETKISAPPTMINGSSLKQHCQNYYYISIDLPSGRSELLFGLLTTGRLDRSRPPRLNPPSSSSIMSSLSEAYTAPPGSVVWSGVPFLPPAPSFPCKYKTSVHKIGSPLVPNIKDNSIVGALIKIPCEEK